MYNKESQLAIASCFLVMTCLAYFLILKMEACSSAMSVDFYWATRRYISEERTLNFTLHIMLPNWVP
jgi:hypothetical protein